ncbi:OB-fold nucleic acid binding domain-containing protein [Burkholderia thailandensis]|uniref:OB-fold nucleic acid binding domain protein n=1 Tax=Burkholderia thailandensis TaxID=57975 RepID=A0AAW9CJI3_BURTH|nr:OB-fold nucleic acid binding domain-containing protein [Burkholderia thailandensis]AHI66519.1 OB-fold nucleic acid binding domain protein [Burkholderia thailandensis H0587]AVR27916.1 hypothetical protein A8H32_23365 [Burkholderia thailandensis]MCS3393118.1 OB-fold nucleic acid binding domain-containing protein [Burkholderia thailandensis]MCS6429039.1 OB-fold nucleic acid binding domain-containing protein [Burkholderia thailandensis]MCS6454526.1 OB-fold nucleic acid binding domain-containing
MNRTPQRARAVSEPTYEVGREETLIGHCVNVRDLGKLVFFTLRSQTSSLQVVCTSKTVIDAVRAIDEHALIEVTGQVQEKHRRREQDPIEHELDAWVVNRIGAAAADYGREVSGRGDPCGPGGLVDSEAIFRSIAPEVRRASQAQAVRHVLDALGIIELPSPDLLSFVDVQALAALAHRDRDPTRDGWPCLHPPFHTYSRRLAAGGLYRFACICEVIPGRRALHVVLCRPETGELQATLEALVVALSGNIDGLTLTEGRGSNIEHGSLARDAQICAGFGLVERHAALRHGVTVGICCVVQQDGGASAEAASALAGAPHEVTVWRGLFETEVAEPIPRMAMLTLWLDACSAGERSDKPGRTSARVSRFDLSVNFADGNQVRGARAAHAAQLLEEERLRVETEILRGHVSEAGDVVGLMPIESALQTIEAVLPSYQLQIDLVHRLLALCRRIQPDWLVERPIDLFQTLWTLLGSASVKSLLERSAQTTAAVERLIEHRIVTDKRQLLYLYPAVLPALDTLLDDCPDDDLTGLTVRLRTLMAQRPTLFSTVTQTLAATYKRGEGGRTRMANALLRSAEIGIATPLLSRLASNLADKEKQSTALVDALRLTGETVFRNDALQLVSVAATLLDACKGPLAVAVREVGLAASSELGSEILYYLYRPITMDFAMFCELLGRVRDRTSDWGAWGVTGHGEFWNAALGCYEYWLDRGMGKIGKVRLYLSKNIGSFFAKSTAGICTDVNVELFDRYDHFHLNIIDADDGRAIGNVQLYVGEDASKRFLLVRGINPIQGWCVESGVDALVRCIIHAISDIAVFGGFTQVRLSQQNGLWNADSSRAEVRACLRRMCLGQSPKQMERPFHLYVYYGRVLTIDSYYSIWEAGPGQALRPISKNRMT